MGAWGAGPGGGVHGECAYARHASGRVDGGQAHQRIPRGARSRSAGRRSPPRGRGRGIRALHGADRPLRAHGGRPRAGTARQGPRLRLLHGVREHLVPVQLARLSHRRAGFTAGGGMEEVARPSSQHARRGRQAHGGGARVQRGHGPLLRGAAIRPAAFRAGALPHPQRCRRAGALPHRGRGIRARAARNAHARAMRKRAAAARCGGQGRRAARPG